MLIHLIAFLPLLTAANFKYIHNAPEIDLHEARSLLGLIQEDQHAVTVSPRLSIVPGTGPICGYELTSTSNGPLPFEAVIQNKLKGTAVISVKPGMSLDCSLNEYSVQIVAVKCNQENSKSKPALLKITVKDVNNHAPVFTLDSYNFDAEEGLIHSVIARIYASDNDCGQPFGAICRYEMIDASENSVFRLSEDGVLSNFRALNRTKAASHILTVVAFDCGMRRSETKSVTVNVMPKCVPKISSVEPVKDLKNSDFLFDKSEIQFCDNACFPKQFEAKFVLTPTESDSIDSYVESSQEILLGSSKNKQGGQLLVDGEGLELGETISSNSEKTELILKTNTAEKMSKLIQKIRFSTTKTEVFSGRLTVTGKQFCRDGREIVFEAVKTIAMVKEMENAVHSDVTKMDNITPFTVPKNAMLTSNEQQDSVFGGNRLLNILEVEDSESPLISIRRSTVAVCAIFIVLILVLSILLVDKCTKMQRVATQNPSPHQCFLFVDLPASYKEKYHVRSDKNEDMKILINPLEASSQR